MKKVFLMLLVLLSVSFGKDCYWEQMINLRDDSTKEYKEDIDTIKIVYICLNNQLYVGSFVKDGDWRKRPVITGINPVWDKLGTSDGIRPKFCKCEK